MNENPFYFLKQTVNVLLVDDSPEIITWISGMLELLGVYYVKAALSTAEAVSILETGEKRFHVCINDLGMNDVENNEFYLMDKYRGKIPFIVITARRDTERGFKCGSSGVKETILKDTPGFNMRLLRAIDKYALDTIICPGFHENPPAALIRFMECLMRKKPASVNEWFSNLEMDDSFFRREWDRYVGVMPKYSLCIFHLFSCAFEYTEIIFGKENDVVTKKIAEDFLKSLEKNDYYQKCKSYFLRNESAIKTFICNKLPSTLG